MGFLDKVKNVTGVGLNSDESYHRAYEKGVLLGKYDAASDLFSKAAAKYEETGQSEAAHRARANQFLYSFIATRNPALIDSILPHLQSLQDIEEIGSENEKVSVAELSSELKARQLENAAFASSSAPEQAKQLHANAAARFQEILKANLKTYKHVPAENHNDTAEERYFLHQGYAFYYEGLLNQDSDPVSSAERISQAALAFKRAKDEELRSQMDGIVSNLRVKRTCWFCHREMQGLGLNVSYYPAQTTAYGQELVGKLGQDVTSIGDQGRSIAVCRTCASMVQNQADMFAQQRVAEFRKELEPQIEEIVSAIKTLANRVSHLESVAHRH